MGEDLLLDINYSEFENKISLYLLNQHNISSKLVIYKEKDNFTLSDGEETPSIFLVQNMNDIPDGLRTPIVSLEWVEIGEHKVLVRRSLFVNDIKTIMNFYEKMENKKIIISEETTDIGYAHMKLDEGISKKKLRK
jgi:hypothetical protein